MSGKTDSDCLFCRIVAGEIPAEVVHETPTTLAFRDIEPQAPFHALVIPRDHHRDAGSLATDDPGTAVDLLTSAAAVAADQGLEDGYRLVFNTGRDANQTVSHVHLHLLGGRRMTWPPG
jgi:histidine triad (HIT) family protein